MTTDKVHRLNTLAGQLAETLMTAAICAQEIRSAVRSELEPVSRTEPGHVWLASDNGHHRRRPLLDESTLSVLWNDQALHLGNTRAFYLLARLARRPNQYVTHLDLSREVWDDEDTNTATIYSMVRDLRCRLRDGAMPELATAIRAHRGRYILDL